MGLTPAGGCYGRGELTEDVKSRILPPEYSCTVYCNQDNFGPVPGGETEDGAKGWQQDGGNRRVWSYRGRGRRTSR